VSPQVPSPHHPTSQSLESARAELERAVREAKPKSVTFECDAVLCGRGLGPGMGATPTLLEVWLDTAFGESRIAINPALRDAVFDLPMKGTQYTVTIIITQKDPPADDAVAVAYRRYEAALRALRVAVEVKP